MFDRALSTLKEKTALQGGFSKVT